MRHKILSLSWLVGITLNVLITEARAQQNSPLTLSDCLLRAFDQNSGFHTIKNLEIIRKQNQRIQNTALFPQLSLSSNLNQYVQNSKVIFIENLLPPSEINGAKTFSLTANFNSNMNLTSFGQALVEIKAQRYADKANYSRDVTIKNNIILLVCQTYFDCLLNQEVHAACKDKMEVSKSIVEISRQKIELGATDSLEYYQALIQYQQDVTTFRSTQSLLTKALNSLKLLLNISNETNLSLDTSIFIKPQKKTILKSTIKQDSSVLISSLYNDLNELKIRTQGSYWQMLPNLSLFAGYGYSNQTFQNGIVQQNSALGFSYGINITYNFGTVKNAVHQTQILKTQSANLQLEIEKQKTEVLNKHEDLFLKSKELEQAILSNQLIKQMALLTLERSIKAYKLGSASLADVRASQNQLLNANLKLKRSISDLFICKIELAALYQSLEKALLVTL